MFHLHDYMSMHFYSDKNTGLEWFLKKEIFDYKSMRLNAGFYGLLFFHISLSKELHIKRKAVIYRFTASLQKCDSYAKKRDYAMTSSNALKASKPIATRSI